MAIALIFDCGATNLRTVPINEAGKIVASHHTPNHTQPDPENYLYHIWDIEEIYQKLIFCAEKTIVNLRQKQIDLAEIKGIGITTFGVDEPFSKNGKQIFPIIS